MSTATLKVVTTKVAMAKIGYGKSPDVLETLLGSCVGVAIWDRSTRLGALAHVVLPDSCGRSGSPGKFADTAITEMREELVRRGANPLTMVAKLCGGSTMFGKKSDRDVGTRNCYAVREQLNRHKIRILEEHVGGDKGRVIRFSTHDASIEVFVGREVVAVL